MRKPRRKKAPELRFYAKTRVLDPGNSDGCVRWTGSINKVSGYGQFEHNYKTKLAHRFIYEFMEGPIAEGMVIDHTCSNRWCVNVSHLQQVTQKENVHRGRVTTHGKYANKER